ncbi:hypothetical protein C8R44DRAFT_725946 [Mycena epipterygia]|nr:hypothetical protein C8R44DRAFT_725946 [Mycena epipterygia]
MPKCLVNQKVWSGNWIRKHYAQHLSGICYFNTVVAGLRKNSRNMIHQACKTMIRSSKVDQGNRKPGRETHGIISVDREKDFCKTTQWIKRNSIVCPRVQLLLMAVPDYGYVGLRSKNPGTGTIIGGAVVLRFYVFGHIWPGRKYWTRSRQLRGLFLGSKLHNTATLHEILNTPAPLGTTNNINNLLRQCFSPPMGPTVQFIKIDYFPTDN